MAKVYEFYVYIIKCVDDTFYIGVTNNLERRFEEHCEGLSETSYTSSRRPLELVYHENFRYIDLAIAREKQLKRWSRRKKKALISGELEKLKEFSKKRFPRKL